MGEYGEYSEELEESIWLKEHEEEERLIEEKVLDRVIINRDLGSVQSNSRAALLQESSIESSTSSVSNKDTLGDKTATQGKSTQGNQRRSSCCIKGNNNICAPKKVTSGVALFFIFTPSFIFFMRLFIHFF